MKKLDKPTKRWLIVLIVFLVVFLITDLILLSQVRLRKPSISRRVRPGPETGSVAPRTEKQTRIINNQRRNLLNL